MCIWIPSFYRTHPLLCFWLFLLIWVVVLSTLFLPSSTLPLSLSRHFSRRFIDFSKMRVFIEISVCGVLYPMIVVYFVSHLKEGNHFLCASLVFFVGSRTRRYRIYEFRQKANPPSSYCFSGFWWYTNIHTNTLLLTYNLIGRVNCGCNNFPIPFLLVLICCCFFLPACRSTK